MTLIAKQEVSGSVVVLRYAALRACLPRETTDARWLPLERLACLPRRCCQCNGLHTEHKSTQTLPQFTCPQSTQQAHNEHTPGVSMPRSQNNSAFPNTRTPAAYLNRRYNPSVPSAPRIDIQSTAPPAPHRHRELRQTRQRLCHQTAYPNRRRWHISSNHRRRDSLLTLAEAHTDKQTLVCRTRQQS